MGLIKPIAYWQQPIVIGGIIPPAAPIPQAANILLRYENPNVNNTSGGTIWTDTSGLGYTTGRLEVGSGGSSTALIDATSNSVQISNTASNNSSRNGRLRLTTNTNMSIKSLAIVFNQWTTTGGIGSTRTYFMDFRRANLANNNAGYFNQYDSVGTGATALYGNNGHYFAYAEQDGILLPSQLTTPANLTDGVNRPDGGAALDQFYGPNGKAGYLPKRMWLFNFNTNRNLEFQTTPAERGMVFSAGDGLVEGSSAGWFSIIAWSTYLTADDATQLVDYYKSIGTLV